jgi:hypothetical protein
MQEIFSKTIPAPVLNAWEVRCFYVVSQKWKNETNKHQTILELPQLILAQTKYETLPHSHNITYLRDFPYMS